MWNQKWVSWVFLGRNFKYTIVIFDISSLEFGYFQNLRKKLKFLNLGTFGFEIENKIVIYEISTLELFLIVNYRWKKKMPKFGNKNAWFLYFWPTISKQYRHIWNQHTQIYLNGKFGGKENAYILDQNCPFPYFWPNMPYFCIFGEEY